MENLKEPPPRNIITVCAWCIADGEPEPDIGPHELLSHGICRRHRAMMMRQLRAHDAAEVRP
jgi:hypothetical protein